MQTIERLLRKSITPPGAFFVLGFFLLSYLVCAIGAGLYSDDFLHRSLLIDHKLSSFEASMELFRFTYPGHPLTQEFRELGVIPWWSDPELKVAFWRPLAALSHWLDYQLWPNIPSLMHWHSLLYFFIACYFLLRFLEKLNIPKALPYLTLLIFMVDIKHLFPLFWLANRNQVMAICFSIMALYFHHLWRSESDKGNRSFLISHLCFSLSLLSAEAGVAGLGYLVSYALFMDSSEAKSKLLRVVSWIKSLWLYGLILIVWRIVYQQLGFGTAHNGLYVDPLSQFPEFFANFWRLFPVMLFGQYTNTATYHLTLNPEFHLVHALISLLGIVLLCLYLKRILLKYPLARFMLFGSAISIIPSLSMSSAGGRLLFFSSIGSSVVIALALWDFFSTAASANLVARWGRRLVTTFLAMAHLIIPIPLTLLMLVLTFMNGIGKPDKASDIRSFFSDHHDMMLLTSPNPFSLFYLPLLPGFQNTPHPSHITTLLPAYQDFELRVLDEHRLQIDLKDDLMVSREVLLFQAPSSPSAAHHISYYYRGLTSVFSPSQPLSPGYSQKFNIGQLQILTEPQHKSGQSIIFRFTDSMYQFKWLVWDWDEKQYRVLELPQSGEILSIKSPY